MIFSFTNHDRRVDNIAAFFAISRSAASGRDHAPIAAFFLPLPLSWAASHRREDPPMKNRGEASPMVRPSFWDRPVARKTRFAGSRFADPDFADPTFSDPDF